MDWGEIMFFFSPCLFSLLSRSVVGCLPALKVVTLKFSDES